MANRKAAKNRPVAPTRVAKAGPALGNTANDGVEPMVIALAEQLGTFLGRVQKRADGWLENEALRQQVSQIRDGASQLLDRVNRAGTAARQSATTLATATKAAAKQAKNAPAASKATRTQPVAPRRTRREGESAAAPAKRLRKPPAEELFDPRLGEPMGKQMGQKSVRNRRSGRG